MDTHVIKIQVGQYRAKFSFESPLNIDGNVQHLINIVANDCGRLFAAHINALHATALAATCPDGPIMVEMLPLAMKLATLQDKAHQAHIALEEEMRRIGSQIAALAKRVKDEPPTPESPASESPASPD
jgi:hypothetical protein